MADVFNEQLVKRQATVRDKFFKSIIIFNWILLFTILTFLLNFIGFVISLGIGYGAYILLSRLNKEYEYVFTNGELDIDVIYNKSTRKRVFNGYVKDFEIMAHVEDKSPINTFSAADERNDYSTGTVSDNSYIFLAKYNNKRTAIIIEPNEAMLGAISKVLTRRGFHPKR